MGLSAIIVCVDKGLGLLASVFLCGSLLAGAALRAEPEAAHSGLAESMIATAQTVLKRGAEEGAPHGETAAQPAMGGGGPSRFLYEIPLMPGMKEDRGEQLPIQNRADQGYEDTLEMIVLRAKEGQHIPADRIVAYYNDVFVKEKGFRQWHKGSDVLSGTFMPSVVNANGHARISSTGMVRFWVAAQGDFIVFWVQHRRDFDQTASVPLLEEIQTAFDAAASRAGLSLSPSRVTFSSDWPEYTRNEYFVGQRGLDVFYKEREQRMGCMDNTHYRFTLSVFPTRAHAEQWQQRRLEGHGQRIPSKWFHFDPRVIRNVVVEYSKRLADPANATLAAALEDELGKLEAKYSAAPLEKTLTEPQPDLCVWR